MYVAVPCLAIALLRAGAIREYWHESQHDLKAFVACAHNLLADRDIYTTYHVPIPEDPTIGSGAPEYYYPPLLGILFLPTTLIRYDVFVHVWFVLNLAFVLHSVWLAVALLPFGRTRWAAVMCLGSTILASEVLAWLLSAAQVDAFLLWVVLLGACCFERGRSAGSAWLVVLATWAKLTPGLILLYLLLRGGKRFAVHTVIATLTLFALQWAVAGAQFFDFFTTAIGDAARRVTPPPFMQSLWALAQLLFVPNPGVSKVFDAPALAAPVLAVAKTAVLAAVLIVLLRGGMRPTERVIGLALCAAGSLLLVDMSWTMRFIWLILPFGALLWVMTDSPRPRFVLLVGPLCLLAQFRFGWQALIDGTSSPVLASELPNHSPAATALLLAASGFATLLAFFALLPHAGLREGWAPGVTRVVAAVRAGSSRPATG
jgi:hypothetical protein